MDSEDPESLETEECFSGEQIPGWDVACGQDDVNPHTPNACRHFFVWRQQYLLSAFNFPCGRAHYGVFDIFFLQQSISIMTLNKNIDGKSG